MTKVPPPDIKQNVRRFDDDVRKQGAYAYTGDRIAKALRGIEPFVERIPLLRDIACGQSIIVVSR